MKSIINDLQNELTSVAFDSLDRVTDISWKDASSNVVRSFGYGYNAVGMITQKLTTVNGQQSIASYTYDDLDRLISETSVGSVTSVVSYSYDLVGNRTQAVVNGQTAVDYTYGSGNRLTSWGTNGSCQYDAAGNATNLQDDSGRQLALTWDSRYRLTSVATNGSLAEKYQYDALGRRVSISDGATTNYLIYDGVQVVAETDSSGTLLKSYVWAAGIDNLLAMTVYGATTSTYYAVKDHLGSVQAVVDSSGSVVESYQYDAWGNVLEIKDGSGNSIVQSAIGNCYLWTGREYSFKSKLYFHRTRYYDPSLGRWLSPDSIGISGGMNFYEYCAGDPINNVDPNGQAIGYIVGGVLVAGTVAAYVIDPWLETASNPGGFVAVSRGPFTFYGPEYKSLPPVLQEATRFHESRHKYHQWTYLPWNKLGRELDAYKTERDWLLKRRQKADGECDKASLGVIDAQIKDIDALLDNNAALLRQMYGIK